MKVNRSFAPMTIQIETESDLNFIRKLVNTSLSLVEEKVTWYSSNRGLAEELHKLEELLKMLKV